MAVLLMIIYVILHILLLLYIVNIILTYTSYDECMDIKNIISEIIHIGTILILFVLSWIGVISKGGLIQGIIIAVVCCDIIETMIFAIAGAQNIFMNKGKSLRERKLALLMNIFFVGKIVKAVRLAYSGSNLIVYLDFIDDNSADARYINGKTLSLFQAMTIFKNIKALKRL